jgi:alcohol dehydrogenase
MTILINFTQAQSSYRFMKTYETRKFVAPEFLFGKDVRLLAGQYLHNYQLKKVLIVTDPTIASKSWYGDIIDKLNEYQIAYSVFDSVSPNPKEIEVMEGAETYQHENCKGILAIGGGSVIDCAKGIGVVSSNRNHILKFEGVDMIPIPGPPIICIPSTAGTSADVSQFSIIRDMERMVKIAIISKTVVPDVALIDPIATLTMDKFLTACTGLDALTHAVEAFVSNANSPITDNHALHAVKLIRENLYIAVNEPHNMDARYNMMVGSLEAGLAFSNASLGAVHAMAHSLGGLYDSAHGECNALLLDHVIEFNFLKEPERFKKIGSFFGINYNGLTTNESKNLTLKTIREFKSSVGINYSLKNTGLHNSDIPVLANYSINDPCIITNPRKANKRDIEVIFENAL